MTLYALQANSREEQATYVKSNIQNSFTKDFKFKINAQHFSECILTFT
jgi:hypothetical protein